MKHFAIILLFTTLSHCAIGQFSISSGYDRRSQDELVSLKEHFTAPAKNSFYIYNVGYLKGSYRANKHLMLTSELGFSFAKTADYYTIERHESGGGMSPIYYKTINYRSTISYSTMTFNVGINRLVEWKGVLLKKVAHSFFMGVFIGTDLFMNYKNENKTLQTFESNNNNSTQTQVVTKDETVSTDFSPLEVNKILLNLGVGITKRVQLHSFFIEFKADFSIRTSPHFTETDRYKYTYTSLNEHSKMFYPILNTGIGFGYVFNKRKVKAASLIGQ